MTIVIVVVISFLPTIFPEKKRQWLPLCRVQGCRRYWTLLYFWRTNPPFPIINGGFLFRRWIQCYSKGLFVIREGGHTVSFDIPSLYCYFYLLFIKDMQVLLPISPFSMEILRVFNAAPSKLSPNSWDFIKAMACEDLDITPTIWVFFYFYTNGMDKGNTNNNNL